MCSSTDFAVQRLSICLDKWCLDNCINIDIPDAALSSMYRKKGIKKIRKELKELKSLTESERKELDDFASAMAYLCANKNHRINTLMNVLEEITGSKELFFTNAVVRYNETYGQDSNATITDLAYKIYECKQIFVYGYRERLKICFENTKQAQEMKAFIRSAENDCLQRIRAYDPRIAF